MNRQFGNFMNRGVIMKSRHNSSKCGQLHKDRLAEDWSSAMALSSGHGQHGEQIEGKGIEADHQSGRMLESAVGLEKMSVMCDFAPRKHTYLRPLLRPACLPATVQE